MANGFTPKRMCVACREMSPKAELVRIVKADGEVVFDDNCSMGGRGAYVHRRTECVRLAQKKHAFERHLKCAVGPEIYEKAAEYCDG